jgi:hypothetical protein
LLMANAGRFEVLFRSVSKHFLFRIRKNRKQIPCVPCATPKMPDQQDFIGIKTHCRMHLLPK